MLTSLDFLSGLGLLHISLSEKSQFLRLRFFDKDMSQDRIAVRLRYDEMCNYEFVVNLLMNLSMKEL